MAVTPQFRKGPKITGGGGTASAQAYTNDKFPSAQQPCLQSKNYLPTILIFRPMPSSQYRASRDARQSSSSEEFSTSSSKMSKSSPTSTAAQVALFPQLIERPYVNQKKLMQKLREKYDTDADGNNKFEVMVSTILSHENIYKMTSLIPLQLRLNKYTVLVPERLTEVRDNVFWFHHIPYTD